MGLRWADEHLPMPDLLEHIVHSGVMGRSDWCGFYARARANIETIDGLGEAPPQPRWDAIFGLRGALVVLHHPAMVQAAKINAIRSRWTRLQCGPDRSRSSG